MRAIDAGSASVSSVNNVQQCMVPPSVHVDVVYAYCHFK
jgi:hypothetical protein